MVAHLGRPRAAGTRHPGGKIKRRDEGDTRAPTLWRRIKDGAVKGGAHPYAGTVLGRLSIFGVLADAEVEAGFRVAEIVGRFELLAFVDVEYRRLLLLLHLHQARRDDGIEACGRLIKHQDLRIHGDSSGNSSSFPHTSRKLAGIQPCGIGETHRPKLHPSHQLYRGIREFCEFLQRQSDVLLNRQ